MQLNVSTDYAVRILVYLTVHKKEGCISAASRSTNLFITKQFLLKVMRKLTACGFIAVTRGRDGGFSIHPDRKSIRLFDVLNCMESTMKINPCREDEGVCEGCHGDVCPVRNFWLLRQKELFEKMQITIEELINEKF